MSITYEVSGQVVSIRVFYSDDMSLNPAVIEIMFPIYTAKVWK